MNSLEYATSPAAIAPDTRRQATFWLVNSAVWAAYAGSLMLPWLGQYSIVQMLPNKVVIAATGVAVSGTLRVLYGWMEKQSLPRPVFLIAALVACVAGAVGFDLNVIALTQGPDVILQRWDGSLGSILGGVPMQGRIGQYTTLLVAWSLGWHLFIRKEPPTLKSAALASGLWPLASGSQDSTLSVIGTTIRARDGNRTILLDRSEIDWIAADGDYIRVHNGTKNFLVRATMKHSTTILAPLGFVRVHRSAIVNPRRVREVVREGGGDHSVVLRNGARIKAGRNYASQLDALLLASSSGQDELR